MKTVSEMDYDDLVRLDKKTLTQQQFDELKNHELVTWWETCWNNKYCIQIMHPQWDQDIPVPIYVYKDR